MTGVQTCALPIYLDYQDGPKYQQVCAEAMKRDLIVNTIQCGGMAETTPIWREIAKLSEGSYAAIGQTGDMIVVTTPVDKELTELNRRLGTTLIAYGDAATRRSAVSKQATSEAAPAAVVADRLSFNAQTGKAVQGGGELLDALADGTVKLETLKRDDLPSELQKLKPAELNAHIEQQKKTRAELQVRVRELNEQRQSYLAVERKRLAEKGKDDAFDEKVAEILHTQAAKKGIQYGK